jgi:pantoate kinase
MERRIAQSGIPAVWHGAMLHATAFCPANISLVFETYPAAPPHGRGSLGVGITLDAGVSVRVSREPLAKRSMILVGGEAWEFPTVRSVLANLTGEPLRVEIEAAFPFGCGFGMSGASALAAALAVNEFLGLGRDYRSLGLVAHHAEVDHATGLGDVGGQFNGGIMIKTRRHHPLTVEHLPIPPQMLHYRIHGPILTSEVINSPEKLQWINKAGHEALARIAAAGQAITMARLFDISHAFAEASGLLTSSDVAADIAAAHAGGHSATMIMLGEAVISTGPFPGSQPVGISFGGASLKGN